MAPSIRDIALLSVLGLGAAACDLGAVGGGGGDDDGSTDQDDDITGHDQLDILCDALFTTSGSFELGAPRPDDVNGCWPIGTWTFTAAVDTNACDSTPSLLGEYRFKVEEIENGDGEGIQVYTYLTEPSVNHRVKVSSGGGGECEGALEIYSDDGTEYWNFKPALNADGSLTGFGEYTLYSTDQWN